MVVVSSLRLDVEENCRMTIGRDWHIDELLATSLNDRTSGLATCCVDMAGRLGEVSFQSKKIGDPASEKQMEIPRLVSSTTKFRGPVHPPAQAQQLGMEVQGTWQHPLSAI